MQQSEPASLVGVRRETIGNLENGRYNPSLKLAMDIAKVFNTTVEDIFTFEDYKRVQHNYRCPDINFKLKIM